MKTTLVLIAATLTASFGTVQAAEPAKPQVTLTVKKHVLDSEHDLRGAHGSSKEKTLTLRVEIVNTSGAAIDGAELSGEALIMRARELNEALIKESLGTVKVPAMKPNEKLTFDLGKITLHELQRRMRKFEESLEEWQVVCSRNGSEIGKAASSEKYASLEKDARQTPDGNARRDKAKRRNGN